MAKLAHATTDEFKSKHFPPHGRVEFTARGNILICEATGPFNLELIDAIAAVQASVIERLIAQGSWGDIIVLKGNAMANPETIAAFTKYLKALVQQGVISSVTAMVVAPDVEGGRLMATVIAKCYAEIGRKLTLFDRIDAATDWMASELAGRSRGFFCED